MATRPIISLHWVHRQITEIFMATSQITIINTRVIIWCGAIPKTSLIRRVIYRLATFHRRHHSIFKIKRLTRQRIPTSSSKRLIMIVRKESEEGEKAAGMRRARQHEGAANDHRPIYLKRSLRVRRSWRRDDWQPMLGRDGEWTAWIQLLTGNCATKKFRMQISNFSL